MVNPPVVRMKTFVWFVAAVVIVLVILLALTGRGSEGQSWLQRIPGH